VRFSFAASQDNISNALENIKKMLGWDYVSNSAAENW
jgi:hypothetical protein